MAALVLTLVAGSPIGPADSPSLSTTFSDDVAQIQGRLNHRGGSSTAQAGAAAPRTVRRYIPACDANRVPASSSPDALCGPAVSMCQALGQPGSLFFWVYEARPGTSPEDFGEWRYAGQICRGAGQTPSNPVPVLTVEDFRRLPLPAGRVHIQPPNLRTLVNVPTNVFLDAGPVILPTTLLGLPVRVRATPDHYAWAFGDGGTLVTTDSGAAYPDLRTTHTYRRAGIVSVSLSTVYDGEYSVAGGPWLPVDGQAQVASAVTRLTVLAARAELEAGNS